ncbi:hypothetical protein OS187_11830 [Xanthomonadaceae bacterium JHOS43]|nr:hypothetical protein [Xanthomonadaceae bacterium JHOS43]MCX7561972.1 hypothetical protein [Xanthomonadaceae bacterium XH05]
MGSTVPEFDSRLYPGILNARSDQRARTLPEFRFVRPDDDGTIRVEMLTSSRSGMKHLPEELERVGAEVRWRSLGCMHLLVDMPMLAIEENPGTPAVAPLPVAGSATVCRMAMRIDGATCTAAATVGIDQTFVVPRFISNTRKT